MIDARYLSVENWVYVVINGQHHGIITLFHGTIRKMMVQTNCWIESHRCFFMGRNISWECRSTFTMASTALLVSVGATISKQVVIGRILHFNFTRSYALLRVYGCGDLALPLCNGHRHWALHHARQVHSCFRRASQSGSLLQMFWCVTVRTTKHLRNV